MLLFLCYRFTGFLRFKFFYSSGCVCLPKLDGLLNKQTSTHSHVRSQLKNIICCIVSFSEVAAVTTNAYKFPVLCKTIDDMQLSCSVCSRIIKVKQNHVAASFGRAKRLSLENEITGEYPVRFLRHCTNEKLMRRLHRGEVASIVSIRNIQVNFMPLL